MNPLIDQFQAFIVAKPDCFKKFDFNDFFYYCNRYLLHALDKSIAKHIPLKFILRMIGTLSMSNFDRSSKDASDVAHSIMINVRSDFKIIHLLVKENEQPLFKTGLVTLLCIELLYPKRSNFTENEIAFLQEMDDKNQSQDIAYRLLCQLHHLKFPIVGDSNWTEIFNIADPAKIDIKYLNLANSLETFIRCVSSISKVLLDCSQLQKQMRDYFEERISKGDIRGNSIK